MDSGAWNSKSMFLSAVSHLQYSCKSHSQSLSAAPFTSTCLFACPRNVTIFLNYSIPVSQILGKFYIHSRCKRNLKTIECWISNSFTYIRRCLHDKSPFISSYTLLEGLCQQREQHINIHHIKHFYTKKLFCLQYHFKSIFLLNKDQSSQVQWCQ